MGLASGFAAQAWPEPRIVGDVDGSGLLSAADAFRIMREGLGLVEPFVPDNPDIPVTPLDALLMINHINAHPGDPSLPSAQETPPRYCDASNDRLCTALDVLVVINYLNSLAVPAGEDEPAPASPEAARDWPDGFWSRGFEFEDVLGQIVGDIARARVTPEVTIGCYSQR